MPRRSRRLPADLGANRIARLREALGVIPYDLTVSNPTACGVDYPPDLLESLAHPRGLSYEPSPPGPPPARRAVAARYGREGIEVNPDHITLTASTSEAYGFLFRLLADPGDTVMVPTPSYPLFDHLARLESVRTATYDLDVDAAWRIDLPQLAAGPPDTRAVVVVHPNNPTGSLVHPDDRAALVGLCRDRGWALIADEVFLPYPLEARPAEATSFAATRECLSFTLGGLSKGVGLPQLKLAWIVAGGPVAELASALEGLEYVADAYLSVSSPVALAAAELLDQGKVVHDAIAARCRSNLAVLRSLAPAAPAVDVPPVGGGWSAVVRVPAVVDDETLCLSLLEDDGVAVHPGYLFGFHRPGFLVISLLAPEPVFAEGARRLLRRVS
jgi:hypothetical protein